MLFGAVMPYFWRMDSAFAFSCLPASAMLSREIPASLRLYWICFWFLIQLCTSSLVTPADFAFWANAAEAVISAVIRMSGFSSFPPL
jgi:hypothetical protein